jgi:hypothetical protein
MPPLRKTIQLLAVPSVSVLVAMASAPVASATPSNYLKLELGKGAAWGGSLAGGAVFLYDYQPGPISADDTGGWGTCPDQSQKWNGSGTATVSGGQCVFSISAWRNCVDDPNGYAGAYAVTEMEINDVVFSGPGTGNIPVSLNLDVVSDVADNGTSFHQLVVHIGSGTVLNIYEPATGVITTQTAMVPLGQPVHVYVQLRGGANGHTATWDAAARFAAAGGVFNLPAGVTANSVEGNIVDNTWTAGGPVTVEPTSWSRIKAGFR